MASRTTGKVRKKAARKTGRKTAKKTAARAPSPQPSYVRDVNVINKDATTREERRTVLASALANDWAAADIDGIKRIDKDNWHGWEMTPRP